MIYAGLVSCDNLDLNPKDPNYFSTCELWARRVKADDLTDLVAKIMEVNKDFLLKTGRITEQQLKEVQKLSTPSAGSTDISPNMQVELNSTTPSTS